MSDSVSQTDMNKFLAERVGAYWHEFKGDGTNYCICGVSETGSDYTILDHARDNNPDYFTLEGQHQLLKWCIKLENKSWWLDFKQSQWVKVHLLVHPKDTDQYAKEFAEAQFGLPEHLIVHLALAEAVYLYLKDKE